MRKSKNQAMEKKREDIPNEVSIETVHSLECACAQSVFGALSELRESQ